MVVPDRYRICAWLCVRTSCRCVQTNKRTNERSDGSQLCIDKTECAHQSETVIASEQCMLERFYFTVHSKPMYFLVIIIVVVAAAAAAAAVVSIRIMPMPMPLQLLSPPPPLSRECFSRRLYSGLRVFFISYFGILHLSWSLHSSELLHLIFFRHVPIRMDRTCDQMLTSIILMLLLFLLVVKLLLPFSAHIFRRICFELSLNVCMQEQIRKADCLSIRREIAFFCRTPHTTHDIFID